MDDLSPIPIKKHKGRPKKYSPAFIRREAGHLMRYAKRSPIPLLQDFCSQRRYSSVRIVEFSREIPIFAEALKRFKDIQTTKLVMNALARRVHPVIAIFTLKNVCGWKDKDPQQTESELINSDIEITTDTVAIDDRLRRFISN